MHRLRSIVSSGNALFVFEAAARRCSFTEAARELNVSQPAVSKAIRLLEESIGLKLFRREHGRLALTAEGLRLSDKVRDSFDELHMLISAMRGTHANDVVRASFSSSFLQLWLLPRLTDFKARHPDVALRLQESARDDEDLAAEDIDISARLGNGRWPGLDARFFAAEEVLPVCGPDYLRRHPPPRTPADLRDHVLLHFEERYRSRIGWREWFARMGVAGSSVREDIVFTDALNALEAAALGQGVALGWRHLVGDYLRQGRLVPALDVTLRSGLGMHIVMPAGRPRKPGTDLFLDWLLEHGALTAP